MALLVTGLAFPAELERHFIAAKEDAQGKVILLQAEKNVLPTLLQYLANRLPDSGWSTLLIRDSQQTDLSAGVNFLQSKPGKSLVLVVYGKMEKSLLESISSALPNLDAIVMLSVWLEPDAKADPLLTGKPPALDIVAMYDYAPVLAQAKQRKAMIKPPTSQVTIIGADHFYQQEKQVVLKRIRGWLYHLKLS